MMQDESVIRVGCLRIAGHFIAPVSQERLDKEGIDHSSFGMHLVIMNAIEQVVDSFLKGEIDGAFLPLPLVMELFRAGLDIKLLLFTNRGGGSLIKNKAASIKCIEDFKDKVILTPCLLSVQNMLLHKMFLSAGLGLGQAKDRRSDVLLEVVPSNIIAEVIKNDSDGDIGGFVAPEPFSIGANMTKDCEEFCRFDSLWSGYPDSVFVLRRSIIKDNPENVRELVNTFIEAAKILNQGTNDHLTSYAETFFKLEHEIVIGLLQRIKNMFEPAKLFPDYLVAEIVQDYMVDKAGLLSAKVNIKELIDASYAENLKGN
jgi:NitT/TauT family transport system substrate-binding protein